MIKAGGTQSS